jgi:hypothetical protein
VPQDSSEWMAALECAVELNNGDFVSEMLAELQMTSESFAPQRQRLLKHALLYLSDDVVDTLLQMTEPQRQLAMDCVALFTFTAAPTSKAKRQGRPMHDLRF